MMEDFLVFTYIWQEDVEKIFKMPGSPHNVNPARAIAWLVGVTNYCIMFQKRFMHIYLAGFYATIYL